MPKLISVGKSDTCLCPDCLIEHLAATVNASKSSDIKKEDRAVIANMGLPSHLKENVDYYLNADNNFVFTKWYFLRRGYCCENGCKHCPY
jgi:hypothetical protein